MKVLFAINNEQISKAIIEKYAQLYKEELEVKSVYYFKALIQEVKANKTYDRILIFEELEPFPNENMEAIDQYLFNKIDSVTDEINNAEIIFVCQERRTKSDKLLKRFFSLGIYNVLVDKDRTVDAICRIIKKPRTKKDAKQYINYGVEEVYTRENTVDEVELQRIITYFKKLGDNTDEYLDAFNRVSEQYSNNQMKIICNFLPEKVKRYLNQNSEKYKMYINLQDELKVKVEIADEDIEVPNINTKKVIATGKLNKGTGRGGSTAGEGFTGGNVKIQVDENGNEIQVIEKVIEKEIIKEVPVVQERNTETIRQVFEVPKDYSKDVIFIGGSKVGTTFLINAIAYILSKNNIRTAILDMTRERNMFYIYTKNNEKLRRKTETSITDVILNNDVSGGIDVNKNLSVFTSVPGTDRKSYNHNKLLEKLKANYKVVLIDADFTTPLEYFKYAKEIYVVQDMDILTVQQITTFLRELKSKDVSLAKMRVIINKYAKCNVSCKKLMEGLAYYYDPQMTFVDELFDPRLNYHTVPFDEGNYQKYINNLYACDMDFGNFTSDFLEMIAVICNLIYPVNDNGSGKPYKAKKFSLFG